MSNQMQDGMAEATRLTRQGRLEEATAVIQRTLGGTFSPATDPPRSGATIGDQPTGAPATGRRAPEPPLRFRGLPGVLDGLSGTMPVASPSVPTSDVVPAGGQFVERSYTNRAGTRTYKLYIPSGYTGQAVPLVIMLHGCTQTPDDFAAGTRMNTLAEKHTFLLAYPAQANTANSSKCWNWFKAAEQQRGQGEPSLIAGITRQVIEEYEVADGRVYVAGMSAGGAMAAIMGATYPDLYAAVGVHSGLAPGAAHDLSSAFAAMQHGEPGTARGYTPAVTATGEPIRTVPAIVFHGDRDTTIHPQNADHLLSYWTAARGSDAKRGPTPRATKRQGQVPGGHAYTCATYHDASGRAIVEQWTIHGLGHAWSGGSLPGSYTDPKGPDASAEMVRFFLQHPQSEPMG